MTDRPPPRLSSPLGNGGQGSNEFRERLEAHPDDESVVADVFRQNIAVSDAMPVPEWWRFCEVLPIAYHFQRIRSYAGGAYERVGEIWVRFKGVGVRHQNFVMRNVARRTLWIGEPRVNIVRRGGDESKRGDSLSLLHFDRQPERLDFHDWLIAVWEQAFVDGAGILPYAYGHQSPAKRYCPVDVECKILPNGFGEFPWSNWEKRTDAAARREVGAIPTRMAPPPVLGDRERGEGGDAAGPGADRRTDADAPSGDDGGVVGGAEAGPDRGAGTLEGDRDLQDGGQAGGDEAGGGGA